MRKQPQVQAKRDPSFQGINTSVMPLDYNRHQNVMGSLQTMGDDEGFGKQLHQTNLTRDSVEENNKEMYRPASYAKALEYKNNRSYVKKTENQFKELDLFVDTEELKYFGLGFYFYVEWYRRLVWLLLAMTIIQGITIVINFMGDGMSSYESSFSTYLIKTTVANYSGNTGTTLTPYDTLLVAGLPAVNFLALLIFALIWKVHRRRAVNHQEEDNTDVKPEKFCIEFQGFTEDQNNEEEVKRFFSNFGPVYEASLIRNHENTLSDFQKLDEIEEEIKEEELQIVLGSGSESTVQKLKAQKQQLQQKMMGLNVHPTTQSAFVHFQFEKSKKDCLEEFKQHYQYAKCSHACCRTLCCCCVPDATDRITFKGNKLLVRSEKVPAPDDINWEHFQITSCGKFLRGCGAFFVIVVFLLLSCCIIGICSIYITSHSGNCDGLNISSYTAATATASGSTTIMSCYCNAHLIDSFTDSTIKTACTDYLTGIYIEQSIQYVVIITATVTNFIFGLVVNKLINCVRPASQGSALYAKTAIYTIFIFLNSIVVPILIYGDIFGFTASNYVSFITVISSDFKNFLQVNTISFYPNFTSVWYRNVSPIFTNFLLLDVILVWVFFLLDKCCFANKSNLENKEGKILQKRMNREITEYSLDVFKESSDLFLVVITVILFSTGVPVLLPLGLINIFSRYVTTRSLLQNNSVRIDGLGQDFTSLTSTILTICLIVCPLFGEWMLIANSKIAYDVSFFTGSLASAYSFGIYQLEIELYLPIYIGISVLAIAEYLLFTFASTLCGCLCSCCQAPPPNYHTRPFWEYAKGMNVLCSYNIRKNDKMRNAVLYLQKYLGEGPKI